MVYAVLLTLFILALMARPESYGRVFERDDRRTSTVPLTPVDSARASSLALGPGRRSLASPEYPFSVLLVSYHKTGVSLLPRNRGAGEA